MAPEDEIKELDEMVDELDKLIDERDALIRSLCGRSALTEDQIKLLQRICETE